MNETLTLIAVAAGAIWFGLKMKRAKDAYDARNAKLDSEIGQAQREQADMFWNPCSGRWEKRHGE